MARPTVFTATLAERICALIAAGQSLRTICTAEDMPSRETVRTWRLNDIEGFSAQYARACEARAEGYAEEIVEIADDDELKPEDKRVRVDARKWIASRLLRKTYGDHVEVEHSGTIRSLTDEQVDNRVKELLEKAQEPGG